MQKTNKKNIAHNIVKVILFLIIGILLLILLSNILNVKWTKYDDFYELEPNSIDYVVVGASHAYHGLDPVYVYSRSGIKGYNLADEAQSAEFSYYWTKECVKNQKPKQIYYDVGNLLYDDNYMAEFWKVREYTGMQLSVDKLRDIWFSDNSLECKIGATFPLFYYHDRWKELTENDFEPLNDIKGGVSLGFGVYGSENPDRVNLFQKDITGDNSYSIENTISEKSQSFFQKIVSLCELNEITLIPIKFPTNSWDYGRTEIVNDYLSQYNLSVRDFSDSITSINWLSDTYDGGYHVNYWGTVKISEYFSNMLQESLHTEGKVQDHDWDERVEYLKEAENMNLPAAEDANDYYWQWLAQIRSDDTVVLVASNGHLNGSEETIRKRLKLLGISDYAENNRTNSFVALIDGEQLVFKKWDEHLLEYNSNIDGLGNVRLVSSGNKSHIGNVLGRAEICINGIDYAARNQGLNIVVYSKTEGIPISSKVLFNDSEWPLDKDGDSGVAIPDLFSGAEGWILYSDFSNQEDCTVVHLEYSGNGYYYIVNEEGRYLTIANAGTALQTPVYWSDYCGTAVQRWHLKDVENETYCLKSLYSRQYLGKGTTMYMTAQQEGETPLVLLRAQ